MFTKISFVLGVGAVAVSGIGFGTTAVSGLAHRDVALASSDALEAATAQLQIEAARLESGLLSQVYSSNPTFNPLSNDQLTAFANDYNAYVDAGGTPFGPGFGMSASGANFGDVTETPNGTPSSDPANYLFDVASNGHLSVNGDFVAPTAPDAVFIYEESSLVQLFETKTDLLGPTSNAFSNYVAGADDQSTVDAPQLAQLTALQGDLSSLGLTAAQLGTFADDVAAFQAADLSPWTVVWDDVTGAEYGDTGIDGSFNDLFSNPLNITVDTAGDISTPGDLSVAFGDLFGSL